MWMCVCVCVCVCVYVCACAFALVVMQAIERMCVYIFSVKSNAAVLHCSLTEAPPCLNHKSEYKVWSSQAVQTFTCRVLQQSWQWKGAIISCAAVVRTDE